MNKGNYYISLVAIIVIGGITANFIYNDLSKRPNYFAYQVQKGDIEQSVSLTGSVKPQDDASLGFETGGKVEKLNYEVGDQVKAGSVLGNANSADLQARYQQALHLARSVEADLDQYQELYKKQKDVLSSLKKSATTNSSDKKAQKNQIEASEAQVASEEEKVSAAYANVAITRAEIAKTIITAPFDGVVSAQNIRIGEVAQSNTPVITLISNNTFKIEAFVSEIDVEKLHIGDSAEITLDNDPGKIYDGKISAIDPAENTINNVSNYKVTLNFSDDVSGLRPGMGANISVAIENKKDVVVVPQNAIFEENGKTFVYVSASGIREKKEIQVGISRKEGSAEIISGLNAGDSIFVLSK